MNERSAAAGPLPPLIAFGRDLRARGLPVGTGRILTFVRGVAALGLTDRDAVYWAGRASLVSRREDIEAFDDAFADWWAGLGGGAELRIELAIPTSAGAANEADRHEHARGPRGHGGFGRRGMAQRR